jgi:hypothetical protein
MKNEIVSRELLRCTPENKTELVDLLHILRIAPMLNAEDVNPAYFDALSGKTTVFDIPAHRSSLEGGGGWWRSTVTTDYLKPYWEAMKQRYGADPFDVDLTPAAHIVTHTHIVERLWADAGVTRFTSVFEHFNYQGKVFPDQQAAEDKATRDARTDVANILGHWHHVPEFIERCNGMYVRNPAWGRNASTYDPGLDNEKVWALLSETWLARHGTQGQKDMLARYSYVYGPGEKSWACTRNYEGFHVDNYNKHVTWKEFQAL